MVRLGAGNPISFNLKSSVNFKISNRQHLKKRESDVAFQGKSLHSFLLAMFVVVVVVAVVDCRVAVCGVVMRVVVV